MIFQTHLIAEIGVHVFILISQSVVCFKYYKPLLISKSNYQKKMLFLNCIIWLGSFLGCILTGIAYGCLPNSYTTLLNTTPTSALIPIYYAYRYIYFVQLFTYQIGLFGILLIQLKRYNKVFSLMDQNHTPYAQNVLGIFLLAILIVVLYNQLFADNWLDWQSRQKDWLFHYLHAIWFFLVCSFEIMLNIKGIKIIVHWHMENVANWNFINPNSFRVSKMQIPLFTWFTITLDIILVSVGFLIHLFGYMLTTTEDKMVMFRFCYLFVSIHFYLSSNYLDTTSDLVRQLVIEPKRENVIVNNPNQLAAKPQSPPKDSFLSIKDQTTYKS
ncbi:hypothetical protein BC833DRAFT_5014 [Globomyces pollinis-pini]|nr:hypothetical protein BC833DRAFT_5014 [Globomyces pollinis-pini]